MTDFGPLLLALAAQVTLPLAGGLLLSRRRDPAAACGPLAVALAAALVLTPIAFLPRPAWPTAEAAVPTQTEGVAEATSPPAGSAPSGGVNLLDLLRLAKPSKVTEEPTRFDGWRIGAFGVLGLAAFGMSRLALGWYAVVRAVRRGTPVADVRLITVANELRCAFAIRRTVRLRESAAVGTAATTGWWRPVVLVSPGWRAWNQTETRAVLAHELAHIARGDFLTRLVGRLAVAVHGYHPFVRWAAGRLDLRQEMAADARAAGACGGRPAYLKCLAALALKADAVPVGPVPTFLCRPRTLLRRIAMLRVTDDAPVRSRQWPALAAVAVLAAAALGLHATRPEALAGPIVRVKAEEERRPDPLDVSYVLPADDKDCVGVYAARAGAVLATPGLDAMGEQYAAVIPAAFGEGKKMFFELKDIDQLCGRVSIRHEPEKPSPNRAMLMSLSAIRMTKDFDWLKQLREWCGELKEHAHGKAKYYSAKLDVPGLGLKDSTIRFYLPDARTLVIESEENVKKLIDGKKAARPLDWDKVEGGTLAVALTEPKTRLATKVQPPADLKDETEKKVTAAMAAVFGKADSAVMGVDIGKTCRATLSIGTTSRADTDAVVAGFKDLGVLALDGIEAATKAGKLAVKPTITTKHGVESDPKPRTVTTIQVDYKGSLGELLEGLK